MTAKSRPAPRSTTAIRRDEEVQKALAEAAPGAEETAPVRRKRDLLWLGIWGGGVALAGALYLLVELRVFSVGGFVQPRATHRTRGDDRVRGPFRRAGDREIRRPAARQHRLPIQPDPRPPAPHR